MISTKGRYALRVIIDISEHREEGYVPLKSIAARQGISKKYLEIIVRELVRGKLVTGVSGRGGGYKLCREPEEINVAEILELMEGTMAPVACVADGAEPCLRATECKTLPMWMEYDALAKDFFQKKKISDFV